MEKRREFFLQVVLIGYAENVSTFWGICATRHQEWHILFVEIYHTRHTRLPETHLHVKSSHMNHVWSRTYVATYGVYVAVTGPTWLLRGHTWCLLCKSGQLNSRGERDSLEDDRRYTDILPQPPPKKICRVHNVVMDGRRLTVNQKANAVSISRDQVENNLHNKLGMSEGFRSVGATALDARSKARQAGYIPGELGTVWSSFTQFSWKFPHPRWVLWAHFEPETKRQSMQ